MTRVPIIAFCAALLAGLAIVRIAAAEGSLREMTRSIENNAALGQYEQAWQDLEALEAELWDKRPLGIRSAFFVAEPAGSYGIYQRRASDRFTPDEPVYVYVQPVGYGYGRTGDRYRIALSADFELRTPSGQVLVEESDFSKMTLESHERNREFQTSFIFTFEGLDAGSYILVIRLRDDNGGGRAETSLPFTVVDAAR